MCGGSSSNHTVSSWGWELSSGSSVMGQTSVIEHYATPGVYWAKFTVTDDVGLTCSDTAEATALGASGGVPPRIVSTPALSAACGRPYVYAEGPTGPLATGDQPMAWSVQGVPGAQVDPTTGQILWLPTLESAGTQHLVLTATNADGSASQTLDVQVNCGPFPFTIGCGCSEPGTAVPLLLLLVVPILRRQRSRSSGRS